VIAAFRGDAKADSWHAGGRPAVGWRQVAGGVVRASRDPAWRTRRESLLDPAGMKTVLTVLVALAMLGVLGVLLTGMIGLVRGDSNPQRSNKLMQWRVALQGIALALFAILMLLMRD
jgi:hypothetical protein